MSIWYLSILRSGVEYGDFVTRVRCGGDRARACAVGAAELPFCAGRVHVAYSPATLRQINIFINKSYAKWKAVRLMVCGAPIHNSCSTARDLNCKVLRGTDTVIHELAKSQVALVSPASLPFSLITSCVEVVESTLHSGRSLQKINV